MHDNEALIRTAYDTFVRGDMESVREFLHPEALWHVAGSSAVSGVYKGHDELLALFARIYQMTDGTFTISARDILATEDRVIALTTIKAARGDRVLDDDGVAIFKIVDGKATEVWNFAENQDQIDAFFS